MLERQDKDGKNDTEIGCYLNLVLINLNLKNFKYFNIFLMET